MPLLSIFSQECSSWYIRPALWLRSQKTGGQSYGHLHQWVDFQSWSPLITTCVCKRVLGQSVLMLVTYTNVCVCSCGLHGKAGPAGLAGADPAAKEEGGYPQRCDGGSEPAETFCHHFLWCEWSGKIYQPGQGEQAAGLHCKESCYTANTVKVCSKLQCNFFFLLYS